MSITSEGARALSFDPTQETRLSMTQATAHPLCRRGPKPLNRSVLQRWLTDGVRSTSGRRIVLESFRHGGLRFTTIEALERFFARINGSDPSNPSPAKLRRDHNRADRELE